ncbi:hypothetical protein Tco_1265414 [Tanacetum coccineum]
MIGSYSDKVNVVSDALSRKERVKSRRVKAAMSKTFGLLQQPEILERKCDRITIDFITKFPREWNSGDDQLRLRWMIYLVVLADAAESVRDAIGFEYCLASSSGWTKLRLPEELNSVHDTFHLLNLKKYLEDVNLHVPLDKIKFDKTLCFVEEAVEIIDREIKKLKRRKIVHVKVRWNSKRDLEFTWEHEDQIRIKYPQLFVDRVIEPAS